MGEIYIRICQQVSGMWDSPGTATASLALDWEPECDPGQMFNNLCPLQYCLLHHGVVFRTEYIENFPQSTLYKHCDYFYYCSHICSAIILKYPWPTALTSVFFPGSMVKLDFTMAGQLLGREFQRGGIERFCSGRWGRYLVNLVSGKEAHKKRSRRSYQ